MYTWIWCHLPGNTALRVIQALLLVAAVSAVLLFVVFPWIEPKLPQNPITGPGTVGH